MYSLQDEEKQCESATVTEGKCNVHFIGNWNIIVLWYVIKLEGMQSAGPSLVKVETSWIWCDLSNIFTGYNKRNWLMWI